MYYYFSRNVYAPDASLAHLTFSSAESESIKLDHFKDQPLVVHFYAAWCGPCIQELPELNKAISRLNAEGFQVIGLTDDPLATIAKTHKRFNLEFPLYNLEGSLRGNGVPSIPTTFVLDKSGSVSYSLAGAIQWGDEETINEIISSVQLIE